MQFLFFPCPGNKNPREGRALFNFAWEGDWRSIKRPDRWPFDVPSIPLGLELEAWSVFVSPCETVDLRLVIFHKCPKVGYGLLEICIVVLLSLEDHRLARRQVNQVISLGNGAGIIQRHFHSLGIPGSARRLQVFWQPHPDRFIKGVLDVA